jgi:TonB family protein
MQSASAELKKASAKVGPGVIQVTTFDATGKVPRTGTGFFVAGDGRLITSWHLVQDAAYGVAKTADGKIRNITGVVTSAPALDLAVLKSETKTGVPSVHIGKAPENNATVALVGSSLEKKEQPLGAITISGHESAAGGDVLVTSTTLSADAGGTPLIDQDGNVVGVVAVANETNQPRRAVIRTGDAIASLVGQTHPESPARWPNGPNETPTPTPVPKGKVVYAPSPIYPEKARNARPPLAGSGRFRIVFDATGQAKEVQIVKSTGQPLLDQAAVESFRKWKSTPMPGHEWSLLIPISFKP